jgi:hypothetical protein
MTTNSNSLTLAPRNLVATATGRLKDEFAGIFAAQTIERFIADSLDRLLGTSKITPFPNGGRLAQKAWPASM